MYIVLFKVYYMFMFNDITFKCCVHKFDQQVFVHESVIAEC